ncbi:MAG: hypothetical protein K2L05_08690, partial [Muribaculaceae bacterium]|nr:hypothetical protein [Muribaculaceae bacterium]
MTTTTFLRRMFALAAVAMLTAGSASAQGYFDDDIYFDAKKAKKEKAEKAEKAEKLQKQQPVKAAATVESSVADYGTGSTRAVDEYNRRGSYKPQQAATTDLGENFQYTRRIERFSNPDIVISSNDPDLQYYYSYADDELAGSTGTASPTLNIYVSNPDPWDNYMNRYFYDSAWAWAVRPAWYYSNPWWSYNYWGPTWSWSISPSWSWGPSWGPSWGWGPS